MLKNTSRNIANDCIRDKSAQHYSSGIKNGLPTFPGMSTFQTPWMVGDNGILLDNYKQLLVNFKNGNSLSNDKLHDTVLSYHHLE
jgi:hypothetical protein